MSIITARMEHQLEELRLQTAKYPPLRNFVNMSWSNLRQNQHIWSRKDIWEHVQTLETLVKIAVNTLPNQRSK